MTERGGVTERHPPTWMVRHVANPAMRRVLPTQLGRRLPHVALLRFTGRRTGRRYEVPVGVHDVDGIPVVFSDARWLANFIEGAAVEVVRGGRSTPAYGVLASPARTASAMRAVLASGVPPRNLGLSIEAGYEPADSDLTARRRALLLHPPRSEQG